MGRCRCIGHVGMEVQTRALGHSDVTGCFFLKSSMWRIVNLTEIKAETIEAKEQIIIQASQ